jgi:hypothetical protein
MGVERAVTRWYVRRQEVLSEIALLEAALQPEQGAEESANPVKTVVTNEHMTTLAKLTMAQERLRLLGPCPKPMMG